MKRSSRTLLLGVIATALPCTIWAGERSSTNYTIITETTDIGGHEVSSTNYSNIGSAGLITGTSTSTTTQTTAKAGYIAQLYSVTGLALDPDFFDVNEGSTNQLLAYATLDDDTFLKLASTSIVWGVVSGPVIQIDVNGAATTGNVYQTTTTQVQATWKGYTSQTSFNVHNVGSDDYGLYAGDGMDDSWQVSYFGEDNPLAASGADPDGDGKQNWEEFLTGTTPTDMGSFFHPSPQYNGAQMELSIQTIVGRKYIVQSSADLATWSKHEEFSGDGTIKVSTFTGLDSKQLFFYRVLVSEE